MPVPVSVDAQIRRLNKSLRELQLMTADDGDDASVLLAEICNSCMLMLDKAMNAIWEKKAQPAEGKNKPHVYFPICASEQKLSDRMRQYQMPHLEEDEELLFKLLASVQRYNGVRWLSEAYQIASLRHEHFPETTTEETFGFVFGQDQGIHVQNITIPSPFVISFRSGLPFHGLGEPTRSVGVIILNTQLVPGPRGCLR